MNEQIIIDQKQTIHRLQQECTEKTNVIIALGEKLQAKEQECETLASQLDFEVQKKECLEQECEELKKIIDEAKNGKLDLNSFFAIEAIVGEYQLELDQLKAENDNWQKEYWKLEQGNDFLAENNSRLKQTLTEIKRLCDEEKGWCNCSNNKPTETAQFAQQILQKIREVDNEDS